MEQRTARKLKKSILMYKKSERMRIIKESLIRYINLGYFRFVLFLIWGEKFMDQGVSLE